MNREIKFKGLNNYYNLGQKEWVYDNNNLFYNLYANDFLRYPESELINIDPKTICQLITKIDDMGVYEYDCFADSDGFVAFFYYNNAGTLEKKYYGIITEIPDAFTYINYQYATNNEILHYAEKWQFIGNWHDGEEFLINKIKELGE